MKTFRKFRETSLDLTESIETPSELSVFEYRCVVEDGTPVNNVGSGNIAGMGVGPDGEPGVPVRKKLKVVGPPVVDPRLFSRKIFSRTKSKTMTVEEVESTFAGSKVFSVDPDSYHQCRLGKNRYHRWSKYVGDSDAGIAIRNFGKNNSSQPIVVMNNVTGEMMYLRHADLHNWKGKK